MKKCPVCKKHLTKKEYEDALGILHERDEHHEEALAALKKKVQESKQKVKDAREDGKNSERRRTQRLVAGKDTTITKLKEAIKHLKKGTTPQTDGLEFEDKLCARLKKEFLEDTIQTTPGSRGGDILQFVMFEKKEAGIIIYECKRTPRIQDDHIQQAYRAKKSRQADFSVLVTTGNKRGFSGLAHESGVLIVAPLGTIPLASLLRKHLIEMLRAKISKEKRALIAHNMLEYITSPQFKNPIEEVINTSVELQDMIQEEAKDHVKVWKRRWHHYQKINWDSTQIQSNLQLVLHGKEPKPILQLKPARLQLSLQTDK